MAILATYEQQPGEKLDYDVYYRNSPDGKDDWLDAGDALNNAKTTVSTSPTGLTVTQITLSSSDRVKLWVSGGVSGVKYKVTLTVGTLLGRVKQDEVLFKIKEI